MPSLKSPIATFFKNGKVEKKKKKAEYKFQETNIRITSFCGRTSNNTCLRRLLTGTNSESKYTNM
jgi:hypothetical protein